MKYIRNKANINTIICTLVKDGVFDAISTQIKMGDIDKVIFAFRQGKDTHQTA